MNLRQRFGRDPGSAHPPTPLLTRGTGYGTPDRYQDIKKQLHSELISKLDLARLEEMEDAERRTQVERVARRLLTESEIRLTRGRQFERLAAVVGAADNPHALRLC